MIEENGSNAAAQPEASAPSPAQAAGAAEPQAQFVPVIVTAGLLVIGNEILSGRTKDKNIWHIAQVLTEIGIDLKEVRVVADEEPAIVAALNELRARYAYVFTTGGIGPTHDDITADSVAKAFGVPLDYDPRAVALLRERLGGAELNAARMRMARIPRGGALIENRVSAAPGFWIDNVIVMAGVPAIMQAMLDEVTPKLRTGAKLIAETVRADLREGDIGSELAAVAAAHPDVMIGSYPFMDDLRRPNTNVVLRARDPEQLAAAKAAVERMVARVRAALAEHAGDGAQAARRPGGST
jgi:molybdenum cofactor synthesis domain-containing protein